MRESLPTDTERARVIIFPIANYLFALPMKAVLKISPSPPELSEGFSEVGLLELEGETILLLNLDGLLSEEKSTWQTTQFLILVSDQRGQLCGIPVEDLPNMIDLSLLNIQPLPKSSRQSPLSRLSRYVALRQSDNQKKPIFLLDIALAIQATQSQLEVEEW
ncbi:chemotaxis protein CheW [Spirulina sp. CS-785/01]|uniref:chemotaxis protein CheW n=1 Tax=Spirulina sp. CS-785/01 TaxID=3021716 RepID=UPI00232BAF71|nr:chemotaxis protein CheW [Spirulina sp. CS-785/01]MDB9314093.1 chemotaxis protein CheW [Spirulina sp. CS-785/01]